jgi:dihydroorotate dehydrogenase (fumarate)
MENLETEYLGLILPNPIIISSSGLTNSAEKIKELEDSGAGAVVLPSLFEEQMRTNEDDAVSEISPQGKYLSLIENAKQLVKIPVIANIHCYSAENWTPFVKKIEAAGADAIELNVSYLPGDKDFTSLDYERIYFELAIKMRISLGIPFSIKLSPYFTNLLYLVDQLYYRGTSGVVLFNRSYEPDIDIEHIKLKAAEVLSLPADLRPTMKWVSFVSSQVEEIDVAASSGVHCGEDVIKLLLAGAKVVQICSAIYKNGPQCIATLLEELKTWMANHNFEQIEEFRGKINYKNIPNLAAHERAQFMKYFTDLQ